MNTIGKLAKELNINVETIRFYEREGLISQPKKPENGYRMYNSTIADRLRFIANAKKLGFTLKEIAFLLAKEGDCTQIEILGLEKLVLIRKKIADLQQLENTISEMTNSCKANLDSTTCPIIKTLK